MNENHKRRLVGALVLVALAAALLPMLLDNPQLPLDGPTVDIPPPPPFEDWHPGPTTSWQALDQTLDGGALDPWAESAVPADPEGLAPDVGAADAPRLDADGLPVSWVAQVGTFADRQNAEQLVARLRGLGHDAHALEYGDTAQTLFRVYTGPYWKRQQAAEAASQLKAQLDVDPWVTQYRP